jgi:Do/DeqQ family serine protease
MFMRKSTLVLIFVLTWTAIAACFYFIFNSKKQQQAASGVSSGTGSAKSASGTNYVNFIAAAKTVTPGVVHIKTAAGSGSGVIIAENGYIATNNHVVENSSEIQVILTDRREFKAELVGRDPNTDLALIKIKASRLPVVKYGNSDAIEVGEWVLAVGYPYSLNTTATAGIISAKGRNLGIINNAGQSPLEQPESPIESFIQTDAAINPGNSGGALVNSDGQLIGINTAIASLTGSYAGYAFAIPVNLAKKILDDFKKFGTVKRGVLGVNFPAPSSEDEFLKQQGIKPGSVNGVFITDIQPGSAASAAGLKEGDIIQRIDGVQLYSSSEFSERIARHRPGDKIELTFLRDGKSRTASATLKGSPKTGNVERTVSLEALYNKLGAKFSALPAALKARLNLNSGVVVTEIYRGGFFDQIGIPPGTVIAYINGDEVATPSDVGNALIKAGNGRVQILAIAPDGSKVAFNFSFGT